MSGQDFDVDTCVARYDEEFERAEFVAAQIIRYENECETDCMDAIFVANEDKIAAALILILNEAIKAERGDIDDKIAFTRSVYLHARVFIKNYANEKAEHDLEHRDD
jgi:hypothetical protein